MARHLEYGEDAERAAEAHLRRLGMRVVARRFRTPAGELDLVMRSADAIVFVEVKARRAADSQPLEAVTPEKQRRLLRAARGFLRSQRLEDSPYRFDLVAVVGDTHNPAALRIEHVIDAFVPPRATGW